MAQIGIFAEVCHPEAHVLCGPMQFARQHECHRQNAQVPSASPQGRLSGAKNAPQDDKGYYLCSKSTGAVTSCTRKYFASAGYFRATASYIAYATLRYEMCPAGVVRNSEM